MVVALLRSDLVNAFWFHLDLLFEGVLSRCQERMSRHPSLREVLTITLLGASFMTTTTGPVRAADANLANNPLTQEVTVYIQDYISPIVSRISGAGNDFELRGLVPFKLLDTSQLVRFTAPLETLPSHEGGATGLSNLTIFDLTLIPTKLATFGVGPLLASPTAGNSRLGSGKWQGGGAAVGVIPGKWGLFAAILTHQHSFGGAHDDRQTSLLTFQPVLTFNLLNNFYLRSSGVMSFDFSSHTGVIPLGLGIGRVWDIRPGLTLNTFLEPQYSVIRSGAGVPTLQVYTGFNLQIKI